MKNLTRRQFLRSSGALMGAGMVSGISIGRDAHAAGTNTTLVCIQLAGGNDSLNTVIPYQDPNYYAVRGAVAIPKEQVVPITAQLGLHPALSPLKALYDQGRMAIVLNVGHPRFSFSHFHSMRTFWLGDPNVASGSGWMGRSLDTLRVGVSPDQDPLSGLSIGWDSQPSLHAKNFYPPLLPPDPDSYWIADRGSAHMAAFRKIVSQPGNLPWGVFNQFVRNTRSALNAHDRVHESAALNSGVVYPPGYFSESLQFIGKLLRVDSTVRFVALQQGSYDTHEQQLYYQAPQLQELAAGLMAFTQDLATNGTAQRVVILLWSEFSRRVPPNANLGTDHGTAQTMILLGQGVKGGVVGSPPSLASADLIDGGNLRMEVDFRRVYATLLDGWMGVNSTAVFGTAWPSVPILL